jgi:molybdate transport system substrate-binding protein
MKIKSCYHMLPIVLATTLLGQPNIAKAAEIRVLCSNGIREVMQEVVPQFEKATKHRVIITYGLSAVLKRQIDAGEAYDVAVLTPPLIDDLINHGKIAGNTRTSIARSGMALAIRVGAPRPDMRTTEALKRTLVAAKSITYAQEGASSDFFNELIHKLALADALKSKIKLTTTGAEAGTLVARGEADLAVLPVSEILPIRGVELLGTFPPDIQGYIVMVAGVNAGIRGNDAPTEFIQFLTAPATLPVLKKKGMDRALDR